MENINKDVLIHHLALNMDLYELASLCKTSQRFDKLICANETYCLTG